MFYIPSEIVYMCHVTLDINISEYWVINATNSHLLHILLLKIIFNPRSYLTPFSNVRIL